VPAFAQTLPVGDGLGEAKSRLELLENLPRLPNFCSSGRRTPNPGFSVLPVHHSAPRDSASSAGCQPSNSGE